MTVITIHVPRKVERVNMKSNGRRASEQLPHQTELLDTVDLDVLPAKRQGKLSQSLACMRQPEKR